MHGEGNYAPILDDHQDAEVVGGREENGWTVVRFRRKLQTCDNQDMGIGVSLFHMGIGVSWFYMGVGFSWFYTCINFSWFYIGIFVKLFYMGISVDGFYYGYPRKLKGSGSSKYINTLSYN